MVTRYLSDHALQRYRRRIRRPRAARGEVQDLLDAGELRLQAPAALQSAPNPENVGCPPDAWVVTEEAVFLMHRRPDGSLHATTCLRRRRHTREQRRDRRAAARAERDELVWG